MVTAKLYLVGAALGLIAVLGLSAGLMWYRGQAISAQADQARTKSALDAALAINVSNEAVIKRLTAYRELDDKLMIAVNGQLRELATQASAAQASVRELEKTNAGVAEYLRGTLPDELKRLLTERAARGDATGNHGGTAPQGTR